MRSEPLRNDGDGGPGRLRKGEFAEPHRTAHVRRIPSSAQTRRRELSNPMIECTLPLGGEGVSHIYVGLSVGCVRQCFGAPSGSGIPNVSHNEYHEHCPVGSRTAYTPRQWFRSTHHERCKGHPGQLGVELFGSVRTERVRSYGLWEKRSADGMFWHVEQ